MSEALAPERTIVRYDEVVGVKVKNAADEDLGKIENLVINKFSGKVCYLVLSFGGFLGMGDKLFALPWEALSYDKDEDCFILNVDKEKLKSAPGFDKNHWPNMADLRWGQALHDFYGTRCILK